MAFCLLLGALLAVFRERTKPQARHPKKVWKNRSHIQPGVLEHANACVGCTGIVQLAGQQRWGLSSAMFLLDMSFTIVASFLVVKPSKTSPQNVSKPIKTQRQTIPVSYLPTLVIYAAEVIHTFLLSEASHMFYCFP